MQFFTFLTLFILSYTVRSATLDSRTKCNADNCYGVMTHTPSVASQFCSTFIQATSIVTITPTLTVSGTQTITPTLPASFTSQAIPSHISQQCATNAASLFSSRLSSACSCISALPTSLVTVTSTFVASATVTTLSVTTPTNIIVNGDFESGMLAPWTVSDSVYGLDCDIETSTDDGLVDGGNYMLNSESDPYVDLQSTVTFEQVLQTVPGASYSFSFDMFNYSDNDCAVYVFVGDLSDYFSCETNDWFHYANSFTAQSSADEITVQLVAAPSSNTIFSFDNFIATVSPSET